MRSFSHNNMLISHPGDIPQEFQDFSIVICHKGILPILTIIITTGEKKKKITVKHGFLCSFSIPTNSNHSAPAVFSFPATAIFPILVSPLNFTGGTNLLVKPTLERDKRK